MQSGVCLAMPLICASLFARQAAEKPQFEVASVKPAANEGPGFPMMREMMRNMFPPGTIPMADPGRVRLEGWDLLRLIAAAYSVRATDVSGPAWLGDQVFDIEAKIPEGTPKEQLNALLQSLLEERFGLKVHRERQTRQGFALVIGKNGPKLKAAGPAADPPQPLSPEEQRAKAQENLAAMMKRMQQNRQNGTPRPGINTAHWDSVTTERFASALVRFVQAPVVDMTGLTGKYEINVETWRATDDDPGQTIFEAVEKLGLKLEPRKIKVETVVVDQVSKTPTAN